MFNWAIFLINLNGQPHNREALPIKPKITTGINIRLDNQSLIISRVAPSILNLSCYLFRI